MRSEQIRDENSTGLERTRKASKEKLSMHYHKSSEKQHGQKVVNLPFPLVGVPQPSDPAVGNKKKGILKPRKALAEILHWGNNTNHTVPPKVSAPQPLRATVSSQLAPLRRVQPITFTQPLRGEPNRPPPFKDATKKEKRPSTHHQPTKKPSRVEAASLYSNLTSSSNSTCRPSMGPDPFGRHDKGAEVIDHVIRHAVISNVERSSSSDTGELCSRKHVGSQDGCDLISKAR